MSADLAFHPLADIFPLLDGAEFAALIADIHEQGVNEVQSMKQNGFIYAIAALGTSYVKIGSTEGPVEERLEALQTGSPFPLAVVAAIAVSTEQGLSRLERQIHAFLAPDHFRGEWFQTRIDTERLALLVSRAFRVVCLSTTQPQVQELLTILPGLCPPSYLRVLQVDGSLDYVPYEQATWSDLEGAQAQLRADAERATQEYRACIQAKNAYQQRMAGEACELIRKGQAQ